MIELKVCSACLGHNIVTLAKKTCVYDDSYSSYENAELNHVLKILNRTALEIKTLFCADCKHAFLSPSFDAGELRLLYSSEAQKQIESFYQITSKNVGKSYNEYVGDSEFKAKRAASLDLRPKIISSIMKKYLKLPAGKIIDIGGGNGENIAAFGQEYNLYVLDYYSPLKAKGIQYFQDFSELEPIKPFDLVVTTHTLEHVVNLSDEIEKIASIIKLGSYVYVEVPCQGPRIIIKKTAMNIHWHVNFFNRISLKNIFAPKGFKCRYLSLRMMPYNEIRAFAYIAVFEYVGEKQALDKKLWLALWLDILTMFIKKYIVRDKLGLNP